MPARSPLTAAARQRSRRPVRHVVCPIVTLFFDSFFVMTDRHVVIRSFVLSPAVLMGLIFSLWPQLQCDQLVHKR